MATRLCRVSLLQSVQMVTRHSTFAEMCAACLPGAKCRQQTVYLQSWQGNYLQRRGIFSWVTLLCRTCKLYSAAGEAQTRPPENKSVDL
jgi:hypothetical protein